MLAPAGLRRQAMISIGMVPVIDSKSSSLNQIAPASKQIPSDLFSYLGIVIMTVLLGAIVGVGIFGMFAIYSTGEKIVKERIEKIRLVHVMSAAARERTVLLQRMIFLHDPFERDPLGMEFNIHGAHFADARMAFLAKDLAEEEKMILERQGRISGIAVPLQNQVIDLIAAEDIDQAKALLAQQAMPLQDEVLAALSDLMNFQIAAAHDSVVQTRQEFAHGRSITIAMSGCAVGIAIYLIWLVRNAERQRREYFSQMQAANRAKSSFLAKMSHEMRTPLTAIIGFAEASLDPGQSMGERLAALRIIQHSGTHLLHIINDILDLSKIEAEMLEIEPCEFSLFSVLNEVHALIHMQAQNKQLVFNINYNFPLPLHVYTDPLRLKQIVINLCGNAVKFTETGSVIVNVSFDCDRKILSIAVQDTGIGLTSDEQSQLFQDFHQADANVQRKYGGTGLGLALSQKLAVKLGGSIRLRSEKGVGSTFTFELPQSAPEREFVFAHNAAQMPAAVPRTLPAYDSQHFTGHVLCAEDTAELAELLGALLRRAGVTAVVVQNGAEAIERVAHERFDMILMDIQMPVLDGISAMVKLKESGCNIPVIAVTANAMKEDREHYRAVGFSDVLVKPINRTRLRRLLETYLTVNEQTSTFGGGPIHPQFASADDAADEHVKRIMSTFVERLPGYSQQLTQAIASSQWKQAREIAHQLCGLGTDMGYPIITELATTLSISLRNENYIDARQINTRLEEVAERIQLGKTGDNFVTPHHH